MNLFKNSKGQTAIEYVLMLVVAALLVSSIFGRLRDWLVGSGDCEGNNPAKICQIQGFIRANHFIGDYRSFSFRR